MEVVLQETGMVDLDIDKITIGVSLASLIAYQWNSIWKCEHAAESDMWSIFYYKKSNQPN
jgi:hypothetical protein